MNKIMAETKKKIRKIIYNRTKEIEEKCLYY